MSHEICRECSTVAHCAARGCIPIEDYDAISGPEQVQATCRALLLGVVIAVLALAAVVWLASSVWPVIWPLV